MFWITSDDIRYSRFYFWAKKFEIESICGFQARSCQSSRWFDSRAKCGLRQEAKAAIIVRRSASPSFVTFPGNSNALLPGNTKPGIDADPFRDEMVAFVGRRV